MECNEIADQLDAYLLGALDSTESEKIEQHLKTCTQCQSQLAQTIQALDILHALPGVEPVGGYAEKILAPTPASSGRRWLAILIVGIALLLLLTAGLLGSLRKYQQENPYRHLRSLENAIWRYHFKNNRSFPKQLSDLLDDKDTYLPEEATNRFKADKDGQILDLWGNPYVYKVPGTHNITYFDLYSRGKNQRDDGGTRDDIKNWKDR